ncbi:hypothetical protein GCM10023231_12750 [Olivibacter ginsenosidimutans]|uniref:Carboxypeptidase-like regulatory domain-containing protein n=1 Tax=Olivibacter ginsenosidimutans TaxID=1176537 RepID=A0ABP9AUG8_9SPHI
MKITFLRPLFVILTLTLLVVWQALFAQTSTFNIQGKITDATDHQALAYVRIYNATQHTNIVSNEAGAFEIATNTLPLTLILSSVGYQSSTITIKEETKNLNLHLQPATISLDTVSIGGNDALRLLREAFRKAAPYAKSKYYGKGYIRQFTQEGDVYTGLQEVFFNGQWQNFAMTAWQPLQGRYANVKKAMISFSNLSFLSFMATGYLSSNVITTPISRRPDSLYHCTVARYVDDHTARAIAVVKCTPKDKQRSNLFSGDIYIDTKTFDVWKLDGQIINFSFDLSGPLRLKNTEVKVLINFKKSEQGSSLLDFAELRFSSKATFGFVTAKKLTYVAKILMYAYDDQLSKGPYTIITPKIHDINVLKNTPYDRETWKNNSLILHTTQEDEIISSFENKKLISNYLHNGD